MKLMKVAAFAAVGAMSVLGLAACSSSSPNGGTATPAATGAAASSVDYASLVGAVLPTKAESYWPPVETQLMKAMPGITVLYSNGDPATEKTNVETLIAKGKKYILIAAQDATSAASEVDEAHAAGATVISLDRLITNTANVDYYVTFDSVGVGVAQGQYLVDNATGTGNHLYLYGGAVSDNNSFLFFQGAWSVLQPKIADGTFVVENSTAAMSLKDTANLTHAQQEQILGQITDDWTTDGAKKLAEANLAAATADQLGVVYMLQPDDDEALPAIDAFSANPAVTKVISTGQNFTEAGLNYILQGKLGMTLWKNPQYLADDSKQIIDAVAAGQKPACIVMTYNNGAKDVPSTKAALITITKDNLTDVVNSSGLYQIVNGVVKPL